MPATAIFLLPSLQSAGILSPNGMLPYWVWWALSYPLEVIVYGIPLLPLGFTFQFLLALITVFKSITREIR